jgi:L,D-transpeptidase catalytic domain
MIEKNQPRKANPIPLIAILVAVVAFAFLLATRGSGEQNTPDQPLAVVTTAAETATTEPPTPMPTPTPAANSPVAPTEGRWIDVDVVRFQVQLMEGNHVLKTIGPVAVGAQIDTGAYDSTQTGLFFVTIKTPDLTYDAPYNTYISHWVGYDPERDNGFHSFLKDAQGNVVDASTGRVSNGCIRSGDVESIYDFAEIGMPVLVHS